MAEHEVILDDERHRSFIVDTELSIDPRFNFKVVYERDQHGNDVHYAVIEPKTPEKGGATKINIGGFKIPPEVDP
ncbi:hypothetical protein [Flavihumibacter solisilvae]|uniref:Uncharacterized protein n=1 Tax=Flavihumibacter solisilvae TaxID=1349421 RepID=A0A0C1L7J9_9BACT|nr:hypothetical protein [Flavihumibacter solisilvae]KIC95496.1 hypothetical protein OI18_06365 [Flavihumibacter solisilvae]